MAFYYGIHNVAQHFNVAFGGKADMAFCTAKCPLMALSGQADLLIARPMARPSGHWLDLRAH